jgi:hypothetical protein
MRMRRLGMGLLALAAFWSAAPPAADARSTGRLWPGFHWGRCLLEIDHHAYVAGRCAYHVSRDGSLEMHGPRQIYSGIDYPRPEIYSGERSNDYFVQVDVSADGRSGDGLWNADIRATHAHSELGRLTRRGACWVNARVRVCLWRR